NLYPDITIVVVSGYRDFEYAQKAVKLHVEDYLIKPITYEAMSGLLYKIKAHLDATVEKNKREYLLSVLTMEEPRPFPNLMADTNEYCVLSFCFGPYSTGLVNLIYAGYVILNNDEIERFFNQRLMPNEKCWVFEGNFTNEKIGIISVIQTQKAHIVNISSDFIGGIHRINVPITISVSLSESYRITKKGLQRRLVLGKSQVLYSEMVNNNVPFSISFDIEKRLQNIMQQRDTKLLEIELQKLFVAWDNSDCPQSILDKLLKHVLSILQMRAFSEESANAQDVGLQINEILSTSLSFSDAFEGFWLLAKGMLDDRKQTDVSADDSQKLICEVVEYMRKNIAEPITLQTLASMVNLSSQYFCALFKKYNGVPPIKFFIGLKINRVKELLHTYPDMPIKDIGEMVGYNNQHHFSKIFKAMTGMSVKEYKLTDSL
ncbi:MAG: helix-turn-helix domain-containing protein, partial [Bacillota bacterium]